MATDLHVDDPNTGLGQRVKPTPKASSIPVPFSYFPSDDGTEANLLVLLHGLGDSHRPFASLGRQLKLPQTAVLALRAPQQIPFLEEQAFQWYQSFDPLGDIIPNPDPTPAIELLTKVLDHLTTECLWPARAIHLFGFAQGGSVAGEIAFRWWQRELTRTQKAVAGSESPQMTRESLGSVVTVCGPLLSYPTPSTPCPTPVFLFVRSADVKLLAAYKKGFQSVGQLVKSGPEGMPRSKDEWEPIMRFWSQHLSTRPGEGLYNVLTGNA